jgi:hypothetical protein
VQVPDELLRRAEKKAQSLADGDDSLIDNCRVVALFNRDIGIHGWRDGNPWRLSRRKWIERYCKIKAKGGQTIPFRLNAVQRRIEAQVLKLERAGKPVRIVILKGRQFGCSTYIIAFFFWLMATRQRFKVKLVADVDDKAAELMTKVGMMIETATKASGNPWRFKLDSHTKKNILFSEPIYSTIQVTSSMARAIGHSETVEGLHMTETSRWKDAEEQALGLEQTLPELPGTYAFDETTAHGNAGYFHDKFERAWDRRAGHVAGDDETLSGAGWVALFFPWFMHQEDRWSVVHQMPLPNHVREQIAESLTADEEVLLQQKYFLREKGWLQVDYDQLAWRRYWISEKCQGSLDKFHEQYPAFPEEAFLATGRPVFDVDALRRIRAEHVQEPVWVGDVADEDGDPLSDSHLMVNQIHGASKRGP